MFRHEWGQISMKKRIKYSFKKSKARSIFDEGSQPSRKAMNTSYLGKTKKYRHFFFEKNLNRYKMGQNWTKWVKIDRDRFFSVSGPRICQYLPKKHLQNNKNNVLLDFGRILGDNHGFGKPWFLVPSNRAFLMTYCNRSFSSKT